MTQAALSDARRVIETSAARGYSLLISILTLVVIARVLGPEGQGTVAAAFGWATLIATVAGLSLGQVIQHRIQARPSSVRHGTIFCALILLLIVLSLIAIVIALGAHSITQGELFGELPLSVLAIACALLPLLIWDEFAGNLFASTDRIRVYNRVLVIGRTLGFAMQLILVGFLGAGVQGALGAHLAGQVIIAVSCFAVLWRLHRPTFANALSESRALLWGALRLHLNTVGAVALAQSSVLILNELAPHAAVGWYHVAWQMVLVLVIVPQAASLVLYSKIAAVGPDRAWPTHKRITIGVMVTMVSLAALAYGIGPWILILLTGDRFQPAAELFRILLPAALGMSVAQLMAPQWISRGMFLATSAITLVIAVMHVGLTVVLVRSYGVTGAAWTTTLSLALAPILVQGYFATWCERQYRRYRADSGESSG